MPLTRIKSDSITAGITIAAGVPTIVTSASLTAAKNTHYFVDTAARTITLPAGPTIGDRVLITVGNFTNTIVGRNSSNIASLAEDMTIDIANMGMEFIYTNATRGWVLV